MNRATMNPFAIWGKSRLEKVAISLKKQSVVVETQKRLLDEATAKRVGLKAEFDSLQDSAK